MPVTANASGRAECKSCAMHNANGLLAPLPLGEGLGERPPAYLQRKIKRLFRPAAGDRANKTVAVVFQRSSSEFHFRNALRLCILSPALALAARRFPSRGERARGRRKTHYPIDGSGAFFEPFHRGLSVMQGVEERTKSARTL